MHLISFIIPCYRSADTISAVVEEIRAQFLTRDEYDYQIILVSDASPDDTFKVIRSLCAADQRIVGLELARNFGQQAARMAALEHIRGEYVVFMDDDGQHPAEGIFKLIAKLQDGCDLVYARFIRKQHSRFKRLGSQVNRVMTELLIGKPRQVLASSFFAAKRFVIEELGHYRSPSPYIFGYLMQITRKIGNVDLEHRARFSGESGYTLAKLLHLWLNGVTGFSVVPLRASSLLGFFCALSGFILGLVMIIRKLLNPDIAAGYSSLMAAIFFVGGMIMIMLGMLGEYVGRIYLAQNALPQYVVREVVNDTADLNQAGASTAPVTVNDHDQKQAAL